MEFCDRKIILSSKRVAVKFEGYRQNSKFCDVSLQSGDTVVKAHRVVLAAASLYFETVLNADFEEGIEVLLNLPDISPCVLVSVLDFIYTGHVTITSSTAHELLTAANKLCFNSLITSCIRYLETKLNTANVLSMLSFAESLECSKFTECVLNYIGAHWTVIAQRNELLELPLELFIKILTSNGLVVDNELLVVLAVIRWLEHDLVSRAPHRFELMNHLFLRRIPGDILDEVWRIVEDPDVAQNLLQSKYKPMPKSNLRARRHRALYVLNSYGLAFTKNIPLRYDTYKKVWESTPSEKTSDRNNPGLAALGGRLYIVGGDGGGNPLPRAKVYDPATEKWSPITQMNEGRSSFGLTAFMGKLYAFGGQGRAGHLSSIEAYDPAADEWAPAGEMPRAMTDVRVVTYQDSIYLLHERSLLRYTPSAAAGGEWHSCAEMGLLRSHHGAAVLNDHLYVVGGYKDRCYALDTVERYSFATDRWEFVTPTSMQLEMCAASEANGVLLVAGKKLEIYDADEDRWTSGPDPPCPLGAVGSTVL